MPDIRLQDYIAKIKGLIREGRQDEAISHCQHILRHYPKHIETYATLGEACLEKELYREAIEFFQRTLGGDPESFIARVGLGIIYDGEGALPEAIWQIERAFELAPGNAEVRRVLQRLYAQRDGVEKTKLKLTRGALGRLYSRNGLYERAISEFHAILRQDPDLADIRVALVEALWRENRRLEAADVCQDILEDLPNCLKANLILGEIWMTSGNEEAAEGRLELARDLDPENRVAQDIMGKESPLPPEEVFIPELEVMPESLDIVPAGEDEFALEWEMEEEEEFAAGLLPESVGEPGQEGAPEEEMPDWLLAVGIAAEVAGEEEPEEEEGVPAPEALEEAGEEEEPVAAEEEPVAAAEVDLEEEEALAVEGEAEEIETAPPEGEEEAPEWLKELEASEAEELAPEVAEPAPQAEVPVEGVEEEAPEEAEAVPAWLKELEASEAEELAPEVAEPSSEEVDSAPPPGVPASLWALVVAGILNKDDVESAMEEMSEEELAAQQAEDVPDWLRELTGEEGTTRIDELAVVDEAEEADVPEAEGLAPALEETAPESAVPAEEEAEEVPDWAKDLGLPEAEEAEEVKPEAAAIPEEEIEEAPTEEEEEIEEIPDWLKEIGGAGAAAMAAAAIVGGEGEAEEDEEVEEIPEWLAELGAPEAEAAEPEAEAVVGEEVEEVSAEEEEEIEEIPEWLAELEAPEAGAAEPEVEALVEEDVEEVPAEEVEEAEEIPEWLAELESPEAEAAEPEVEALVEEEVEGVPSEEVEEIEEVLADEEEETEEIPDWLKEVGIAGVAATVAAAALGGEEEEDEEVPAEEEEEIEEIPEWLAELESPEAEVMAPAPEEAEVSEASVDLEEPEAEDMAPAGEEPALEAEVPVEEKSRELPDWLKALAALDLEEAEMAFPQAEPPAEEAGEEAEEVEAEEPLPVEEVEEVPEWVSEVEPRPAEAVEEAAPEQEVPVEEEEIEEALPEPEAPVEEEVIEEPLSEPEAPVEEEEIEEPLPEPEAPVGEEEIPEWLREVDVPEAEEVSLEQEEEGGPAATDVPESLQALVEAGILDEADLESAMAEMTDEDLAAQREEKVPDWLRELTGEDAEPAPESAEVEAEPGEPPAEAVPESLEALVEAGILDEADLESVTAEMSEEELEAPREEEVPDWLKDVIAEEAPTAEEVKPGEESGELVEEILVEEEGAPAVEAVVPEVEEAEEAEQAIEEEAIELEAEPAAVEASTPEETAIQPPSEEVLEELEAEVEEEEYVVAEEEGKAGPPTEMEMVAPYDRVQVEERLEDRDQLKELQERLRGQPRDFEARLQLARLLREERDWNAAMNHYEKLISARQFLPTVIEELRELVGEEVNLPRLYQLIGDAHMQEGDLDKALEMYRTAQQTLMK